MKHEFILEGLNCAHCAAKIEQKLNDTQGYSDVRFSFATKALSLNCDKRNIKSDVQALVDSVEDGVTVVIAGEQNEEEEEDNKLKIILLASAAVLFIAAFITDFYENLQIISAVCAVASILLSGYDVIIEGVKSAFKLRIDETTLMTIAVAAAVALGDFTEAAAVTVLFGIGELLEDKAVEKSRRDIRALADIRPETAMVIENSERKEIPAKDVEIGSLIEVAPHKRVPVDGVIVQGETEIDASALTGESERYTARVGDEVKSGVLTGDSGIQIRSEKAYADSAASKIISLVEESSKNKGEREKLITRFARVYTPAVIVISLIIAFVPPIFFGDLTEWIKRALVCLVASCPCSIVISVPLSYFAGIGAASRRGALIKGGRFVEALAAIPCVAFDKTGTLTDNDISVKEIISYSNYSEKEILQLAASVESRSEHPIARAITKRAEAEHISLSELSDYTEQAGFGVKAQYQGEEISCGKAKMGKGIELTLGGKVIGVITFSEHIRSESFEAVKQLRSLNIKKLVMLTGDKSENAQSISDKLGLDEYYSELLPEDKVDIIETLIKEEGGCAFVGDGINDAPSLSRASCGIAMGLGSEAAIESADVVLSSGTPEKLAQAVIISRKTMNTVKANIIFSLSVKLALIVLAAAGIAPMWLAVFADTGVCALCILNATRLIKGKY